MIVHVAILLSLLAPDDKGDLLAAAKKAAEAKSYTFKGETKVVLPEGLAQAGPESARFEGRYERDAGAVLKTDSFEFVAVGGKTAVRPIAEWRALKEDGGEVQRLLYQALLGSRIPRLPHEEFGSWASAVSAVRKTDQKETVGDKEARIYEIEFTKESARELIHALFPMGKSMDRLPFDDHSGTARVWLDSVGRLLKVESTAKVSTSIQGAPAVMTATRTMTITEVDATKVQIPDDARKLLEPK